MSFPRKLYLVWPWRHLHMEIPQPPLAVLTLGQPLLLSRPNILGCKLNPILTFPPPGKMKDFFSRLCIVRGCFVSRGRRHRQQPCSQLLLPFPRGFRKGLCSPSGKDKLQLVPTRHDSLTGFVLAVKGVWWCGLSSLFKLLYSFPNSILLLPF